MFSTIEFEVSLLRSSEDILKILIRLDEDILVVLNCIIMLCRYFVGIKFKKLETMVVY